MRGGPGVPLLLFLVWGCCCALQEAMEDPGPWERIRLWQLLPDRDGDLPGPFLPDRDGDLPGPFLPVDGPRDKKSTDPASLFSVAKELQGFGKERAGFRFRFGRREEGNQVDKAEPEVDKRSATALGSLAEELNGYNRKKGGFSFRFGRR